MQKEEKIILEADVTLPIKETIEVYNLGTKERPRYIVTENTVRRELSTHKTCECGNIYEKNSYCSPCYHKNAAENYSKKEYREWDELTPVCLYHGYQFFFNIQDIEDYLEDTSTLPEELDLMICEENHISNVDEDYWSDIMPDNWDSMSDGNKEFVEKLKEFNDFISKQPPFSWREGKYRTSYKREENGSI